MKGFSSSLANSKKSDELKRMLPLYSPKQIMFDTTARTELEEMLGYERYILKACNDAIRQSRGVCGPTTIVIPDEGPNQICLDMTDTLCDTGAGMTHRMCPLIFATAYKLLDMVVEWTIRENGMNCPFAFDRKVRIIDNTPSLVYPDFIAGDEALRDVLIGLFKAALPYRNAITHNKWGKNVDGDLHFDFHKNGQHYTAVFRFDTILALAEATSLLGDLLVNPSADPNKLNTMKWLLDRLTALHGKPAFDVGQPRYFHIIRQTQRAGTAPVVIDLTRVRSFVGQQASSTPVVYDLTVEANSATGTEAWEILSADMPSGDSLNLDAKWDSFRVSR